MTKLKEHSREIRKDNAGIGQLHHWPLGRHLPKLGCSSRLFLLEFVGKTIFTLLFNNVPKYNVFQGEHLEIKKESTTLS